MADDLIQPDESAYDVKEVDSEVLDKLPGENGIRAIDLRRELGRGAST